MGRWKTTESVVVIVHRKRLLLHIIDALCTPGCFASGLHGRQEKADQNSEMAITTKSSTNVNAAFRERRPINNEPVLM